MSPLTPSCAAVWLAFAVLAANGFVARAASPEPGLVAELPFLESAGPRRIVIDLAPEGHDRRMPLVLDTGATHSVLTPRRARELGVAVRALKQDPYRRRTALGRDLHFYVDTGISDTAARRFEYSLLGGSFLRHYVFELDFATRRVRFFDPSDVADDADPAQRVELELVSNRPGVEIELNGRTTLALLDTGSPLGLIISGELARSLGIESTPIHSLRSETVLGPLELELAIAENVNLGGHSFGDLPIFVSQEGVHNLGFPGDSVLGLELLSRFRIRFDYASERADFAPLSDAPARVLGADARLTAETGALIVPGERGAIVHAVLPDSPADRHGVKTRDRYPAGRSEQSISDEILADLGGNEPTAPDRRVWLRVQEPTHGSVRSGALEWVRVAGRAGSGDLVAYDIAVVIDTSGSTAYASGLDVDGDGKLGRRRRRIDDWRSFNPRHLSSDGGDTVLAAERMATRILATTLAHSDTRFAVVSFADAAVLRSPLGFDRADADAALEELAGAFGSGMTNLADAVRVATEALAAPSDGTSPRKRVMLILSDGYPTYPGSPKRAAEAALQAAHEARDAGVAIHTFALGLEKIDDDDVFSQIAELTGGRLLHIEKPGEVIYDLPRVRLADRATLEIQNRTTGKPGRAIRVGPDGSFDGYVELTPGENRVRVLARGEQGGAARIDLTLHYEAREPANDEEARRFAEERERLQQDLRARTLAAELALEIRRARQRRELEITPAE